MFIILGTGWYSINSYILDLTADIYIYTSRYIKYKHVLYYGMGYRKHGAWKCPAVVRVADAAVRYLFAPCFLLELLKGLDSI